MRQEKGLGQFGIPAVFDIETTNLGADFGIILCAVVKPIGNGFKPRIFRLDNYVKNTRNEDKLLVKDLKRELSRHDFLISYNGARFDIPFINTRLMYHKLTPMQAKLHIDMYRIAKSNFRMWRKGLAQVIGLLDIPEKKTLIEPKYWRWAMMGDKQAMNKVVEHCIQDVLSLEMASNRLIPLVKNIKRG